MSIRKVLVALACAIGLAAAGAVPLRADTLPIAGRVTLTASSSAQTPGVEQCITALIEDDVVYPVPGTVPVPGASVVFTVTGANTAGATLVTDFSGQARFCYTPAAAGFDTINAYADADTDGRQDFGEPGDSVTADYKLPRPAGRVRAWGANYYGQLGNGAGRGIGSGQWPSAVYEISGGGNHTLAVATNGTVWAAGYSALGQAGWKVPEWECGGALLPCNFWPVQIDKTPRPLADPPPPLDLLTQITNVSAGSVHSLALDQNGTVWAWGGNGSLQLGNSAGLKPYCYDGTANFPCRTQPMEVLSLLETRVISGVTQPPNTYVRQIAAGGDFSLVLKAGTDEVWGWGDLHNHWGGDGYPPVTQTPIALPGLSGVRQIAAGNKFGLVVKWDGTVWAWGNADTLGENLAFMPTPVQIPNLTGIVAVAAGSQHALALKGDGTVWAWGQNLLGQLGTGAHEVRNYFATQVGGATPLTGIIAIAAGSSHSLALKGDGTVWGWGTNIFGEAGGADWDSCSVGWNGPWYPCARSPVQVPGVSGAFQISAGAGTSLALVRDVVPPTTTAVVSPTPNAAMWNKTDTTVSLSAVDETGGSGVRRITYSAAGAQSIASTSVEAATGSIVISSEGNTTLTFQATDEDGNVEAPKTILVRIDKTAPTGIAGVAARAPDQGLWYRSRVIFNFTGIDALSGMAPCTDPSYEGPDGADVTVSGACADLAGNEATAAKHLAFDGTPPSITASRTPAANAFGWSNTNVTVSFGCTDAVSGIDGCEPNHVLGEGDHQSVTGDAVDKAGNHASATLASIRVDKTAPAVSCGVADGVWHKDNVSVGCTAADALSGLSVAADAAFVLATGVPAGGETANAATNGHAVPDVAGNAATVGPIAGNKVDRKAPGILIAAPLAMTYTINQTLASSYTCSDGGSGIATCTGTVPSGSAFSTAVAGAQSFSVAAQDQIGNGAGQTVSYVVAYEVCLLYDPARAKNGGVFPVKLSVCDAGGQNLSNAALAVTGVGIARVSDATPAILDSPGDANPDGNFRFDPALGTGGGYIFNVSTAGLTPGTYAVRFLISGDPTVHQVPIGVK